MLIKKFFIMLWACASYYGTLLQNNSGWNNSKSPFNLVFTMGWFVHWNVWKYPSVVFN